ncbi:hypothetical protein J1N35_004892 [Gossypium stocksii]|uniref:Uncharacterized protein n=1 Tax=Gossypium stocksii TaxID=47602 RepID=A0A9D3WDN5_9ROSI|nr:hypothetical protein J1N35_004892 [Gossypium stocksii]
MDSNQGSESDSGADSNRNTKKVRFKEVGDGENINMVVDSDQQPTLSFKDKLLQGGMGSLDGNPTDMTDWNENDLVLLDGDVNTSIVNGIPTISLPYQGPSVQGDGVDSDSQTSRA